MAGLLEACGQGGVADAARQEAYDCLSSSSQTRRMSSSSTRRAPTLPPRPSPVAPQSPTASPSAPSGARCIGHPGPRRRLRPLPGPERGHPVCPDVRLAASRRFLESAPGGITPAAAAAHLHDHGSGPWGAPGARGPVHGPPGGVGEDFSGVSVCMHVRGRSVTAGSMIAELPSRISDGAPLPRLRGPGQPVCQHLRAAFPRTAAGPAPFVPLELSGEELWRACDAVRRRVEVDPEALTAVREVLHPVEDELWADADDVLERPDRWAAAGAACGEPGPACAADLYPLIASVAAIRCGNTQCTPTRQGGRHDHRLP